MKKSLFIISLIAILLAGSCQNDNLIDCKQNNTKFLSLPQGTDFSTLSQSEIEIICLAFDRIRTHEDNDGAISLSPSSAQEANISEELYDFIYQLVNEYNSNLITGEIKTRSSFTSDGEGEYSGPTDCVAYAIAYANIGINYAQANDWLTNAYGTNGVPINDIYSALSHFAPCRLIDARTIHGKVEKAILIYGGHAVNVLSIDGNDIVYFDNQEASLIPNTTGIHYCTLNSSMMIYQFD